MMVIDAHVYCLPERLADPAVKLPARERVIMGAIHKHPEGRLALSRCSTKAILASMRKSGIARSVLVSFPWAGQELCIENNNHIITAVAENASFLAICSVKPGGKGWLVEAERCLANGAVGIKVNPSWQGCELDGPEIGELAEFIETKNSMLMIHIDHPFRYSKASPAGLLTLAAKYPRTKILAAHLGGLLGLYTLHQPIAGLLGNVWYDTAVSSTLELVKYCVEAGLEKKIIFGSDFPFNHSHSQSQVLDGIRKLGFGEKAESLILERNFLNLIKKGQPGRGHSQ